MNDNQATWIGVAFGALTLAGTTITGIFAYLNNRIQRQRERDKLEFDSQLSQIRGELATCRADRIELRAWLDDSERECNALRMRVVMLENPHQKNGPGSGTRTRRNTPAGGNAAADTIARVSAFVAQQYNGDYHAAFTAFDVDGDGRINGDELHSLLRTASVGNFATRNTIVAGIMKKFDTDHDGKIGWDEFETAIKPGE